MNKEVKVEDLVNLVNYQDGSVVSKTVMDKKTGTVTLFAFDQDQMLSEHTSPFDAMVYVLDGKVEITISGNPMILDKGKMVIMPADEPHSLKALEKLKMVLTMIRP